MKEFSDFETYNTPEFRHPPVNGIMEELESIGLLDELVGLKLYYNIVFFWFFSIFYIEKWRLERLFRNK